MLLHITKNAIISFKKKFAREREQMFVTPQLMTSDGK